MRLTACPNCGGRIRVEQLEAVDDSGFVTLVDGRWDCEAACYLAGDVVDEAALEWMRLAS